MRKLIVSMMVSVDGYIEDSSGKIDWHVWDMEMEEYMLQFFDRVDELLFGRKAYQLMESYWPTESGSESPRIAAKMNGLPKVVFSSTLSAANWDTSVLLHEVNAEAIQAMKEKPGKDMVIFGGAGLVSSFRELDLIDEYQLIINPVALGGGKPLFDTLPAPLALKPIHTQAFSCGNVLIVYQKQDSDGSDRNL